MVQNKLQIPCQKIISGGQTGVDRAALDICLKENFPCGGWCPKERRAEDGSLPENYPLQETEQLEYKFRTEKNILVSDGTLIISCGKLSGGTLLTQQLAIQHCKPLIIITNDFNINTLANWLIQNNITTLNVAGPRKSEWTEGYETSHKIISELIGKIKS